MSLKFPDRWQDYTKFGKQVEGTSFIPLKVPLKSKFFDRRNIDCFTPEDAVEGIPNLGLIIDLTYTKRYYDPMEFVRRDVKYEKICTQGHEIPKKRLLQQFIRTVNDFLADDQNKDKLIGVHCTHGLNRTGYFVCAYMILVQGEAPIAAIKRFNVARCHEMERANYLNSLLSFTPASYISTKRNEDEQSHRYDDRHSRRNRSKSGSPRHRHEHRNGYNHTHNHGSWRSDRPREYRSQLNYSRSYNHSEGRRDWRSRESADIRESRNYPRANRNEVNESSFRSRNGERQYNNNNKYAWRRHDGNDAGWERK